MASNATVHMTPMSNNAQMIAIPFARGLSRNMKHSTDGARVGNRKKRPDHAIGRSIYQ